MADKEIWTTFNEWTTFNHFLKRKFGFQKTLVPKRNKFVLYAPTTEWDFWYLQLEKNSITLNYVTIVVSNIYLRCPLTGIKSPLKVYYWNFIWTRVSSHPPLLHTSFKNRSMDPQSQEWQTLKSYVNSNLNRNRQKIKFRKQLQTHCFFLKQLLRV